MSFLGLRIYGHVFTSYLLSWFLRFLIFVTLAEVGVVIRRLNCLHQKLVIGHTEPMFRVRFLRHHPPILLALTRLLPRLTDLWPVGHPVQ
jgi:hypothetical protein